MATATQEARWSADEPVRIATVEGDRMVPALTHPLCPGLAVTMSVFGQFCVTHVPSGMSLGAAGSGYERMANAVVEMVEWALIAREAGFSWGDVETGGAAADALKVAREKSVPFDGATVTQNGEKRPMTIGEWMDTMRGTFSRDEFPWEGPDDDPAYRVECLIAEMR